MQLVAQLRDLQSHFDLLPFALIHNGLLQRLRQARADDVADLFGLEQGHYGLVVKAAVGAKQAHCCGAQVLQCGLDKAQYVAG